MISKETVYRNDDGTGAIDTSYSYSWHTGTLQIEERVTTLPAIPTSQNGSGTSNTRTERFDKHGNLIWSKDEGGFIHRNIYDAVTGVLTQSIQDVDTTSVTDEPSGWTTPSGGGKHLVSDFEYDDLGRMTQTLGPGTRSGHQRHSNRRPHRKLDRLRRREPRSPFSSRLRHRRILGHVHVGQSRFHHQDGSQAGRWHRRDCRHSRIDQRQVGRFRHVRASSYVRWSTSSYDDEAVSSNTRASTTPSQHPAQALPAPTTTRPTSATTQCPARTK